MKKNLFRAASIGLIVLSASPFLASAQSVIYPYSGSCIVLTAYQQLGSSDAITNGQVTALQQFLNRTGYLNGVTGYFDGGTYGAVVNYQRSHSISGTGTVGPITRSSINLQNCNGSYTNQYQNPNAYHTPPALTSFSASSAVSGSSVTIYGSNFAANNATVHFGGSAVTASYATDTSLTFIVPYLSSGVYQVYVSNSYGSSNTMSFTISGSTNNGNCSLYGNSYQCNCTYSTTYPYTNNNCNSSNYNNNYTNNNSGTWFGTDSQPRVSSISGQGMVSAGSSNTWSAMAYSINSLPVTVRVDWGDGSTQQSSQGNSSASQSYPFSHVYTSSGSYTIRFTATDSTGAFAYATLPVSVYGYSNNSGSYSYNSPSLSSLSSNSAYRGSSITVYGTNIASNATVTLSNTYGSYSYTTGTVYSNGTAMTFTVPYVTPGTYNLTVTNSGQTSNALSFTVN